MIDRTFTGDGAARFRVLHASGFDAWTCPVCGGELALSSALKSPGVARFRIRLECAHRGCVDLIARVHDRELFERLASSRIRMRNEQPA